jgi:hypothetical protein
MEIEADVERDLSEDAGVAEIAAGLIGATTVRRYHDLVLIEEPGTRQATPWHQDQPYDNELPPGASMEHPLFPVLRIG